MKLSSYPHLIRLALALLIAVLGAAGPLTVQGQFAGPFIHPGGLHTKADLDRMKAMVAAREHPWIDGWELMIKDPRAQSDYKDAAYVNMGDRLNGKTAGRGADALPRTPRPRISTSFSGM